jgi:DNA-binding NtrC family response regulator
VRELVRAVLERAGMRVVLADDGRRGVTAFETATEPVRLVIVDLTMPGLDGRETLAAIQRLRPGIPAILMSGYAPIDLLDSPAHLFLQKPFTPARLRAAAKEAIARGEGER